jgi:hypothetical protein
LFIETPGEDGNKRCVWHNGNTYFCKKSAALGSVDCALSSTLKLRNARYRCKLYTL